MSESPEISIVIPALNEAPNLPPLAERISAALVGRDFEIIIVDDNSRDDTQAVCAELSKRYPLRLIVRSDAKDGLSGAVLRGFSEARGEYLLVMDVWFGYGRRIRLKDYPKPIYIVFPYF